MRLVDAQQARRVLDRLVGYKISPHPLEEDPPRAERRPRPVGRAAHGRRPRARDRGVRAAGVLDHRRAAGAAGGRGRGGVHGAAGRRCPARRRRRSAAAIRPQADRRRPAAARVRRARGQEEAAARAGRRRRSRRARCSRRHRAASASPRSARWRSPSSSTRVSTIPGEGQVGLITYMRTDSLNIAQVARDEARGVHHAASTAATSCPTQPRFYKTKSKGAQEAHEAIRPTSVAARAGRDQEVADRRPVQALQPDLAALPREPDGRRRLRPGERRDRRRRRPRTTQPYLLRASASHLRFPGFRQVYIEGRDTDADEDAGEVAAGARRRRRAAAAAR